MPKSKSETSAEEFFPERKTLPAFREAAADCKSLFILSNHAYNYALDTHTISGFYDNRFVARVSGL